MTRGSTPRFDLYEELEVSRQATPEVIEAAYRALVKRYHPDVASPEDQERITRLNVARDWLLSPTRRARYDGTATATTTSTAPRPRAARVKRQGRLDETPAPRPARTSSPESFGVNSREVRQFLAEVREIDGVRAASVLVAKGAVGEAAYTEARDASLAASRAARTDEWGFARDAASVIVRGKLADSPFARAVAAVVADVAGAIVVRDLLPASQFVSLLQPWTESKSTPPAAEPVRVAPQRTRSGVGSSKLGAAGLALAGVRVSGLSAGRAAFAGLAAPAGLRITAERRPVALGILGTALALLIVVAVLGRGPREPDSDVAGLTSQPSVGGVAVNATSGAGPIVPAGPSASALGVGTPGASDGVATLEPNPVDPGGTDAPIAPTTPTFRPAATATPKPTLAPTPRPTRTPAPTPVATPVPTPVPTPSPRLLCTVVDLIGTNSSNAQLAWSTAGFTGSVLFSPAPPPQYKIAWQSLTAGGEVSCASDVTVQATAP